RRFDLLHADLPVDLVKLDVEGFEPRVVRGMERMLARCRPIVVSEYAPSNLRALGGTQPEEYLAWFHAHGYAARILDGDAPPRPAEASALARALGAAHH